MRRVIAAAVLVAHARAPAIAEPLPSGAIGIFGGAISGSGADAKRIGYGYQFGLQASWQPTTTEQRLGWTLRWATLFDGLYNGTAPQIEPTLHTVQMDLTIGLRVRPWTTVTRYLTFRAGGELLRANEPIPANDTMQTPHRSFVGGIASVGLDQYLGSFMFNLDVRYGMIGGSGPTELALMLGVAVAGP